MCDLTGNRGFDWRWFDYTTVCWACKTGGGGRDLGDVKCS